MQSMISFQLCVFLAAGLKVPVAQDPCLTQNHKPLPSLGTRNDKCIPSRTDLNSIPCDRYLPTDWYIAENAIIATKAPTMGTCGVAYPIWMIDHFGPITEFAVVNRTVCIQRGSEPCDETFTIQIKNCSTFYVYYLVALKECTSVYCFDSGLPCTPPTTTTAKPTTDTTSSRNHIGIWKPTEVPGPQPKPENLGLIVGLAVGCTVLIIVTIIVAVCIIKLQQQKHQGQVASVTSDIPLATMSPPPYSEHIYTSLKK